MPKRLFLIFCILFFLGNKQFVIVLCSESYTSDKSCGLAELVKRAQASVVSVRAFVSVNGKRWSRVGSGFVYNADGFIITVKSIIQGGDSIIVNLADGRKGQAWVVSEDEDSGVALLRFSSSNLVPIVTGKSSSLVYQSQLTVLGNSIGVFPSVMLGTYLGKRSDGMLEFGGVIPPGNCGSPVLDEKGKIVGILMGRVPKEGCVDIGKGSMGIVLPIEEVKQIIFKIFERLENAQGWLGISVVDLDNEISAAGVRVVGIVPEGPAALADICVGDTIISFEGKTIPNAKELANWVRQTPPNRKTEFLIRKGKKEILYQVRIGVIPWVKK